ncbi:MAG TPA: hypothetical protein DDY68_03635 [Porphyromonadaceae bacterium]|nr:hypothetical protein [Porphyromonadaceae bacterium]
MITDEEVRGIKSFKELVSLRCDAYKDLQENTQFLKNKANDALKIVSLIGNISDFVGIVLKSFAWFNHLKWGLRFFSFLRGRK